MPNFYLIQIFFRAVSSENFKENHLIVVVFCFLNETRKIK